jgi:hypothetical protein
MSLASRRLGSRRERRIGFGLVYFSAIFWCALALFMFGAICLALLQIANMRP